VAKKDAVGFDIECPACRSSRPKELRRTVGTYRFLSCPVCSFQFIHPYMEDGKAFNDYSWTKEYTENYDRYVDQVITSLRKKVEDVGKIIGRTSESFLDVGCGNGIYLHAADVLGLKNLGTDVDKVNVEFARSKGLNAVAAAVEDLELADRYDFIHLKAVLHLVPDPPRLLAKVRELLAPGGVVYIDVPNQGSLFSKLRMLRDRESYGQLQLPLRRGAYNYRALTCLCDKAGLKIVRRIFPYPGDEAYYPLEIRLLYRTAFKLFAKLHISSLIGVYLVKTQAGNEATHG
jgi:SAM-dependent methyltransferase